MSVHRMYRKVQKVLFSTNNEEVNGMFISMSTSCITLKNISGHNMCRISWNISDNKLYISVGWYRRWGGMVDGSSNVKRLETEYDPWEAVDVGGYFTVLLFFKTSSFLRINLQIKFGVCYTLPTILQNRPPLKQIYSLLVDLGVGEQFSGKEKSKKYSVTFFLSLPPLFELDSVILQIPVGNIPSINYLSLKTWSNNFVYDNRITQYGKFIFSLGTTMGHDYKFLNKIWQQDVVNTK